MSSAPTSDVQQNLRTIAGIYEAFGKGDVPAILGAISPEVEWEFGTPDHGVPWLRPGRGHAAVVRFFEALGATLELRSFEVLAVMGEGEWVVGLVRLHGVARQTGKPVDEACEAHIWRLDAAGKVVGMRHAADTHTHWLAVQG